MNEYIDLIDFLSKELSNEFNTLDKSLEEMTIKDLKPFVELYNSGVSSVRALAEGTNPGVSTSRNPEIQRVLEMIQNDFAPYVSRYHDLTENSFSQAA